MTLEDAYHEKIMKSLSSVFHSAAPPSSQSHLYNQTNENWILRLSAKFNFKFPIIKNE